MLLFKRRSLHRQGDVAFFVDQAARPGTLVWPVPELLEQAQGSAVRGQDGHIHARKAQPAESPGVQHGGELPAQSPALQVARADHDSVLGRLGIELAKIRIPHQDTVLLKQEQAVPSFARLAVVGSHLFDGHVVFMGQHGPVVLVVVVARKLGSSGAHLVWGWLEGSQQGLRVSVFHIKQNSGHGGYASGRVPPALP